MKYLFIHQNIPGQWVHIATELAKDPGNRVTLLGTHKDKHVAGVEYQYHAPELPELSKSVQFSNSTYTKSFESAVRYGQSAAEKLWKMKLSGYTPDIICCHPGWGEGLFLKDVYPNVPYVAYTEFYYKSSGADVGFIPGTESIQAAIGVRCDNSRLLISLEQADYCITPTQWQYSMQPDFIKQKTAIIHEGVSTKICCPKDNVQLTLPCGTKIKKGDEVITYVARNMEPYRGFPNFMRALPQILAARPNAHVVITGGDGISYGKPPFEGGTWKEKMLREVPLDLKRVHFLGVQPYEYFLAVLRVSSAHIYLTYPFVLSWSMLEAMSCEALIIGSNTQPLFEVIEHEKNGILVDFFDVNAIAKTTIDALENPQKYLNIRKNARNTILQKYDMDTICLPQFVEFLTDIALRKQPKAIKTDMKMNVKKFNFL